MIIFAKKVSMKVFGFDDIKRKLGVNNTADSDEIILRNLKKLGDEMCAHAVHVTPNQASGGFNDQTKALRNSYGYRIFKDGNIILDGGFSETGQNAKGVRDAHTGLDKYSQTHNIPPNGWVLLIVAGENYAQYVEAKGFNVLHLTDIELQERIKALKQRLKMR